MAAANVTLGQTPTTFEVDNSTAYLATKDPARMAGRLRNGGAQKVFIAVNTTSAPATTDATAAGTVGLAAGAEMEIPPYVTTFTFKSTTGVSFCYWFPSINP